MVFPAWALESFGTGQIRTPVPLQIPCTSVHFRVTRDVLLRLQPFLIPTLPDLLSSAYNGNTYEKAMACLVALRVGCVMQEEPKEYNSFLTDIAEKCRSKRLSDFWELIVQRNLTLISKQEAPDSEVTQDEATSFLSRQTNRSGDVNREEEVDEMEALFDDII